MYSTTFSFVISVVSIRIDPWEIMSGESSLSVSNESLVLKSARISFNGLLFEVPIFSSYLRFALFAAEAVRNIFRSAVGSTTLAISP